MSETHSGTCFCEAVDVEITGEPLEMGYCHCTSCRRHSGAPLSAFALYKRNSVKITRGEEFVQHFNKTGMSDRYFCRRCGGNVMVNHPGLGLSHIHPANFPTLISSRKRKNSANKGRPPEAERLLSGRLRRVCIRVMSAIGT